LFSQSVDRKYAGGSLPAMKSVFSGGASMSKKGGKKDKSPKKPPMANKGPKKK